MVLVNSDEDLSMLHVIRRGMDWKEHFTSKNDEEEEDELDCRDHC